MKYLLITAALTMTACSTYQPIADLRASEDKAQLYQRDVSECKSLVSQTKWDWEWTVQYQKMVNKCLDGRGHSVLSPL